MMAMKIARLARIFCSGDLRCFCVPACGQVDLAATSLVIAAVGAPARAALTPMGNSQGQLCLQDVDSVRFEMIWIDLNQNGSPWECSFPMMKDDILRCFIDVLLHSQRHFDSFAYDSCRFPWSTPHLVKTLEKHPKKNTTKNKKSRLFGRGVSQPRLSEKR